MVDPVRRLIGTEVRYSEIDKYDAEEREDLCCIPISEPPFPPCAKEGKVVRPWQHDDEDTWPEAYKELKARVEAEQEAFKSAMQNYWERLTTWRKEVEAFYQGLINAGVSQEQWPQPPPRPERPDTNIPSVIRFIPRKNPCGIFETRYKHNGDCCDAPPEIPLAFIEKPDGPLAWNTSYRFCVEGGTPPYTWGSSGAGLSIKGYEQCALLSVSDCFCKPGLVICQDACNRQISTQVVAEEGYWSTVYTGPADEGQDEGVDLPQPLTSIIGDAFPFFYWMSDSSAVTEAQWDLTGELGSPAGDCTIERPEAPAAWGDGVAVYPTEGEARTLWGLGYETYTLQMYDVNGDGKADGYAFVSPVCDTNEETGTEYVRHIVWIMPNPEYDIGIEKWECDQEWDEMVFDDENSADVVEDNSEAWVFWDGGKPPFRMTVSGDGFFTDYARTKTEITTNSQGTKIYTSDSCGSCKIVIRDSCEEIVYGWIKSAEGQWENITGGDNHFACPVYAHHSLWDVVGSSLAYEWGAENYKYKISESYKNYRAYYGPVNYGAYTGDCSVQANPYDLAGYTSCVLDKCEPIMQNIFSSYTYGDFGEYGTSEVCVGCGYNGVLYDMRSAISLWNIRFLYRWVC